MIKNILLTKGYSVTTEYVENDYETGKKISTEKSSAKYADAYFYKDKLICKKKTWICPYCLTRNTISPDIKIGEEALEEYSQLSFFDDDLKVIYSTHEASNLECECCGNIVIKSDEKIEVVFTSNNSYIKLSNKISNIKELIESNAVNGELIEIANQFPVFQSLCFDFDNHKVFSVIENSNGEILKNIDIDIKLKSLIEDYISIKNCICESLKQIWKPYVFPFEPYEINYNLMVLFTKYVRYTKKDFYFSIPNKLNAQDIFCTFESIAEKLCNFDNLPDTLNEFKLTQVKSIKRILFSTPQLMFYIYEIGKLWDTLKDINFLTELLVCPEIYSILACVHMYPNLVDFFKDFISLKPKRVLLNLLIRKSDLILSYGIFYISLRNEIKDNEKEKWKERNYFIKMRPYLEHKPYILFAIPIRSLGDEYKKQIQEYEFNPIKTLDELHRAGVELNNCLVDYNSTNNPVIIVKNDNKAVAAIEIKGTHIIQAYANDNEELSEFPKLNCAVKEYCQLCNLKWVFTMEDI